MPTRQRLRILWILPPVIIGVLVMMFAVGKKPAPVRVDNGEAGRAVRTITVPQVDLRPVAEGYGVARPARVWTAVAQVSGRVIETHPRLRDGEIIPGGTLLVRIDPVDYELALAQRKAELAEIEVQESNTRELLEIEQRNLALAEREAARLRKLASQGTTSRSTADEAERAMLNSRTAVQNLSNSLALLPTQRKVLEARLAQAERDLQNTAIHAPFDLRIANLAIEKDQFVSTGQQLFAGDDVARTEIIAQVAISSIRHLFSGHSEQVPDLLGMREGLAAYADLQPRVQMDMGGYVAEWEAEFVRFSDDIDSSTRTLGVVVAVDRPFQKIIPGRRPPLSKGMFVRVRLSGRPQPGQIVVPRSAVRDGKVLLVDDEQRLQIVPVQKRFDQGSLSVIATGLSAGQRLVVSDLVPAVPGMLLLPQADTQLETELLRSAGLAQ